MFLGSLRSTAVSALRVGASVRLTRTNPRRVVTVRAMAAGKGEVLLYNILPEPGSCPYAQRAWLALEEKGIPYKHILVDPQNKPEDFKQLYASIIGNDFDSAKVPTIVDGDFKLTESLVVLDYLETAYPDSGLNLLPADPAERANVRLFAEQYTDKINSYLFKFFQADSWPAVEELKPQFIKNLLSLDAFLKRHGSEEGGSFFLGGRYGWAEVVTAPFTARVLLTLPHYRKIDPLALAQENGADRLARWFQASIERASVKETMPAPDVIIQNYSRFIKPIPDS
eukprot:jgi/Botrbrau1/19634/Bobra.0003s0004.1